MSDRDSKPPEEQPEVYANTRHGRLSLDEIGKLASPGLGTLMPVISDRFGWMAHAGIGGNWKLAAYQLRKVNKLFATAKVTRPKWTDVIDAYAAGFLDPIAAAIGAADREAFARAVDAAVDEANAIHRRFNYGYIVYKVPAKGPAHMETGPVEED
jgi:hypothetical protein